MKEVRCEVFLIRNRETERYGKNDVLAMTDYSFRELVNTQELQRMMDIVYELTGFPIGIIDVDNTILVATGWQDICTKFHRCHPETLKRCHESDHYIEQNLKEGSSVEYKCRNGLWDIAQPIIIEGRHMATIFLGQFLYEDEKPDEDFFIAQAQQYGFDMEAYMAALHRLPVFSRETVQKLISFYVLLAKVLSQQGLAVLHQRREIESRKRTEQELQERQRMLTTLMDNLPGMAYRCRNDKNWTMEFVSNGCSELTGYLPNDLIMNRTLAYGDLINPQDRQIVWDNIQYALGSGEHFLLEYRIITRDEQEKWVWEKGCGIFSKDGEVRAIEGFIIDVTKRKQLERQLVQSQKMESIGTLTGGIAHDFNNLLTVINGHAEMAMRHIEQDEPCHDEMASILQAGKKAENLIRQLLAFSRRQVYEPEIVEINTIITGLNKLFQRLIGEDIVIETALGKKLPHIKADPGQMEQILMNLMINARDALKEQTGASGEKRITIETGFSVLDEHDARRHIDIEPGAYVVISVSDTGIGMDDDVMDKIFDPFFTTKVSGKGTGLGLSTVYGIVRQNNAGIYVYSEKGLGTSFRIYWPVAAESREPAPGRGLDETPLTGSENILLVEDDESVRRFARDALSDLGYHVYEASSGMNALSLVSEINIAIDLIVTDLIMPGMDGRELADELAMVYPDATVIYTSGYADEHIVQSGALEPGIHFIQKPYSVLSLSRKIRDILDKK